MNQSLKRGISLCLSVILTAAALLWACPAPAHAAESETVRVGIFSLGRFMGWDEAGNACGYNIDFLDRVAAQTNWNYEYVDCGSWTNATQMLENGEIDLLAPAQITEALSEKFDYSALYMGTEAAAIYTKTEHTEWLYEDFETMNTLTYGVPKGSTFARKFTEEYCVEHDMAPKIVEYANTTELQTALAEDEVDAIVTNIMFASDDCKLLGWYSLMPVYYIARPESKALLTALDDAMMQILAEEPDYIAQLESSYFPIFDRTSLTFEEQQFVNALPVIKVGYEVNHEPLSYTDEETGEFAGITREILDRISENSGIRFIYVPLPSEGLTYDYLRENGIYVLSDMADNAINNSAEQLKFSSAYLEADKVIIAGSGYTIDQTESKKIARVTGPNPLVPAGTTDGENVTYVDYPTTGDALKAVQKHEVDGLMINRYTAEAALENPSFSDLKVISTSSMADNKCLTTLSFEGDESSMAAIVGSKLFLSVLNKSISQLPADELNAIILDHTANQHYRYTLQDMLREYWQQIAIFIVFILICIFLLLRARNIEASKKEELAAKSGELELKNRALSDAVQEAERANGAKSQFLSRMSHEIRTPMNAIVGLTTIAKSHENEPERMDEYLTKIDASSKVLLSLINDVLDMSAIESSKLKIAKSEFDIKQILTSISTIYYTQCKNKGVDFSMAVDVSNEMLIGDSLRVEQILMNLVSNAYKFTGAGGRISIKVTETSQKDDRVYIRFEVSDTGCGMSRDMLERIFKPFEQETAETAKKHGGSGLGMSIAKNLVDIMEGAIKVESEQGVGTTFTVDLPFEATGHAVMVDMEKVSHMCALIVDDDETARNYTSVVVGRLGIKFDMASSGAEALELIRKKQEAREKYDICFVDWKMPDMDGVKLTQKIRETFDKNMAVIIISAYDLNEVEDEGKKAGADMFITKPLFQSTVFNTLIQITGGVVKQTETEPQDYDFSGHRLLLAEDNELNTEIATELLHMVNMEVDHAENGQKAVEMFTMAEPGAYDLILMDIQMPIMDGYEAAQAIRTSGAAGAKTIPIFAMTANAFTEDVSHSLSSGMNGHLSKPIDTAVLYKTIHDVLSGEK